MVTYPLYVDDRAGSSDLIPYLVPDVEPCRMEFGDAMVIGNGPAGLTTVGVEVKSISDLMQSANTGRLAGHQLPGLLATYDVSWLLGFGPYRPGPGGVLQVSTGKGGRVHWKSFRLGSRLVPYGYLESFLFDVQSTGCRVKHVYDAEEAAIWLRSLHRWWSKAWTAHKGLKQFDCSKDMSLLPGLSPAQDQMARVAKELPGVGFGRAVAVASHFASISEMMSADARVWATIPGIGKVIAEAVVAAIQGR